MSIAGIGASNYGMLSSLVSDSTSIKQKLDQLTNQASSGYVSNTYAGLGSGASVSLDLTPQIASLKTYQNNIDAANGSMQVTQTAMTQIQQIASNLLATVDSLSSEGATGVATAAASANSTLAELAGLLDTQDGSSYVFAGQDSTNPPVPDPNNITSSGFYTQINAAVGALATNGAAATTAATLAIAGSNAQGTSPFSTAMSPPAATLQVAIGADSAASSQGINLVATGNQLAGSDGAPAANTSVTLQTANYGLTAQSPGQKWVFMLSDGSTGAAGNVNSQNDVLNQLNALAGGSADYAGGVGSDFTVATTGGIVATGALGASVTPLSNGDTEYSLVTPATAGSPASEVHVVTVNTSALGPAADLLGATASNSSNAETTRANVISQMVDRLNAAGFSTTNSTTNDLLIGGPGVYAGTGSITGTAAANSLVVNNLKTANGGNVAKGVATPLNGALQPLLPTAQVGPGQTVSTGLLASANVSAVSGGVPATSTGSYMRDLMCALATVGSLNSAQGGTAAFNDMLQSIRTSLTGAVSAMATDAAALGGTQSQITAAQTRLGDEQTALTNQLSSVQDTNMAETLSKLSLVQTQLQASYQVIASMSGLSLAKYLPA
jgi:flagellar hook-associated protein 3 FlgL